ncbi:nuclear transport factor 2 family protein [Paracoccus sp. S3-43]|uniref:nuclear transport factor 2 family protein n=1 Tax=Paracoccus sp. S3-43 TaxID=3030011 RepID=UPI0023AEAA8B|nr:nuclear transport factor 2 family protein [Paracoccus sp. S3-43]WEF23845.1 nuclear transport factor 2 family protein [Paracoccus sp. S3-43]
MDDSVTQLFRDYEALTARGLRGDVDADAFAAFFAPEFIGASPQGVRGDKNDAAMREAMAEEFVHHRKVGAKAMRIEAIRVLPLDAAHCVASVDWIASYGRKAGSDAQIRFTVHYFVQRTADGPRIFGWVSGDEQAALKEQGIL